MPIKSSPLLSFTLSLLENLGKMVPRIISISFGYLPNKIGSKILQYYSSIIIESNDIPALQGVELALNSNITDIDSNVLKIINICSNLS